MLTDSIDQNDRVEKGDRVDNVVVVVVVLVVVDDDDDDDDDEHC